ncbi:MAG: N-acetyltransferase [Armatimonadota bacterium]|mgnify:CR=1 FL=1|nr:N-acetyltransferase [Acidobacteriota bacterium]
MSDATLVEPVTIRKAQIGDVAAISALVGRFAALNLMLPRSPASLFGALRDFFVATDASERLIGCAALAIMSGDLAEVRSLAVEPESQGLGLGRRLVGAAMDEARQLGLPKVFALTRAPGFFEKLGFEHTDMKALPQKVWTDCIHCPLFPDCDEVALIREL